LKEKKYKIEIEIFGENSNDEKVNKPYSSLFGN
jgi:hypothetical protein